MIASEPIQTRNRIQIALFQNLIENKYYDLLIHLFLEDSFQICLIASGAATEGHGAATTRIYNSCTHMQLLSIKISSHSS